MKHTATAEDYARVFEKERQHVYPVVDAFEQRMGYAIDRAKLEEAARVLACPFKDNDPCWQHGRVIYAAARKYLEGKPSGCWTFLDIGTAKSFSALCLQWALNDHAGGSFASGVTSVDVIDPKDRIGRNTVAEIDGLKTLAETVAPWPEASLINFEHRTGIDWLFAHDEHIHVAFVDGKHTGPVVAKEGWLLSQRQESGDLAIFDDVQIPDIDRAVRGLSEHYELERIVAIQPFVKDGKLKYGRAYAVGVRK